MESTEKKGTKNGILITTLLLITLLFAILETTFAYFSASSTSKNQNIETGTLKVSVTASAIAQTNIVPVSKSSIETIENKINNKNVIKMPINVNTIGTDIEAVFDIYLTAIGLENKEYINGNPADIKWELLDNDNNIIGNGTFEKNVSNLKLNKSSINIEKDVTLYDYKLLIYILETNTEQDDLQNLTINASISVNAKQK